MPDHPALVSALTGDFLRVSRDQLQVRLQRIEACLERLSDEQIWSRRHEVENAVGNLVLHLCGNITQWIIGGVGGAEVTRDRDAEFARREPLPADELAGRLRAVVQQADAVLAGLTPDDLTQPRRIQGLRRDGATRRLPRRRAPGGAHRPDHLGDQGAHG